MVPICSIAYVCLFPMFALLANARVSHFAPLHAAGAQLGWALHSFGLHPGIHNYSGTDAAVSTARGLLVTLSQMGSDVDLRDCYARGRSVLVGGSLSLDFSRREWSDDLIELQRALESAFSSRSLASFASSRRFLLGRLLLYGGALAQRLAGPPAHEKPDAVLALNTSSTSMYQQQQRQEAAVSNALDRYITDAFKLLSASAVAEKHADLFARSTSLARGLCSFTDDESHAPEMPASAADAFDTDAPVSRRVVDASMSPMSDLRSYRRSASPVDMQAAFDKASALTSSLLTLRDLAVPTVHVRAACALLGALTLLSSSDAVVASACGCPQTGQDGCSTEVVNWAAAVLGEPVNVESWDCCHPPTAPLWYGEPPCSPLTQIVERSEDAFDEAAILSDGTVEHGDSCPSTWDSVVLASLAGIKRAYEVEDQRLRSPAIRV